MRALAKPVPPEMTQARCRGLGNERFFPGQGDPTGPATDICRDCPARDACLEYALTEPIEKYGIWGGKSEAERRRIRRARRRASHPATPSIEAKGAA